MKIPWPEGKDFAFTIFDDTDHVTLDRVKGIYSFLQDHGFRTTKSVWPIKGNGKPKCEGATCEDPDYLAWLLELQAAGFEIGYHMSTYHSSKRQETMVGLERFAELFGHYPKSMANHTGCRENIYWGSHRVTGINATIYNLLTKNRNNGRFTGHVEGDEYFWGDLCREKVKYVRNFIFADVNTLKACPFMPYHDPKRPYVNYWFASSDGHRVEAFNKCIAEENQDRLEEEGGACIMYTHFASKEFRQDEHVRRFRYLMVRLSKKNGWFVPVSTLLDYLLEVNDEHCITARQRKRLERKWLFEKLFVGTT